MGLEQNDYFLASLPRAALMAIFFLLVLLCLHVGAQQNPSKLIKLGSALSPRTNPSWTSHSGHFAFGFYPQGSGFAVGIWLVGDPNNTIVWTANRDDPPVSLYATLKFTTDGLLLLQTEDGIENPVVDGRYAADSASMLDTGNFVLFNNNSVIWESFDNPTDTLLGGQNLTASSSLVSSVSSWNHSTGHFFLIMQDDGNLVAYVENSGYPEADARGAYWSSGTFPSDYKGLNLNNKGLLSLYDDAFRNHTLANSSGNEKNTIYRATFEPDGVFRMYTHQLGSGVINLSTGPKKEWESLEDLCEIKGHCGLNSYCSRKGNDSECYCYPGFAFIDENDNSIGCSQNFTVDDCIHKKNQVMHYNMTSMDNMEWSDNPYHVMQMKMEDCKMDCQSDCYCGAALFSDGKCKKYKLPLRYGKRNENIKTLALIKLMSASSTNQDPSSVPNPTVIFEENPRLFSYLAISLGSVTCLCLLLAISGFLAYRKRIYSYRQISEDRSGGLAEKQFRLRSFSYIELEEATDDFKEVLGRGSYEAVYKGTLPVDNKVVSIKRFENVYEGEREFQAEMTAIGRTSHKNLVRLLGYCVEGPNKLLVYEYLSNGSLADFLFGNKARRPNWKERVRIAKDVAKGILYLHEECVVRIIHCNIKPQNILLDDSLTAKISGFGLAKLMMPTQTSITGIKATGRHSAPEWQMSTPISVKVDVYSFGMVLLEIICCRSSIEVKVSTADEILLSSWAYNCFQSGQLNKLIVIEEEEEEVDLKMLERMVKVGLWCIQDNPNLRPSMKNVMLMLEGTMAVSIPPSPLSSLK